jgi:hypothetical protein
VRGSGGNQFYEWVRTGAVRRLPRHQPESCHRCGGGGVRATQSGGAGEVPDTHRLIPQSWQASSSARNNILSVSVGVRRGTPYLLRRTGGGGYGISWKAIFNAKQGGLRHFLGGTNIQRRTYATGRCKALQGATRRQSPRAPIRPPDHPPSARLAPTLVPDPETHRHTMAPTTPTPAHPAHSTHTRFAHLTLRPIVIQWLIGAPFGAFLCISVHSGTFRHVPAYSRAFRCIPAHFGAIRCIPVHSGAFQCIPVHSVTFRHLPAHSGVFQCISAHPGTFRRIPVHFCAFRCVPVHSGAFRHISVHFGAFRCL